MGSTISAFSIVCMAISALVAFALPVGLYLWLRKRRAAVHAPFWIGVAVFVVFALVLEQLAYLLLIKLPFWGAITSNVLLYGLVGGFMAGLFEETGRYFAFGVLLKKHRANNANALMYGAGHGGIEAALLLGVAMISNIVFSIMFNSGASLPANSLDAAVTLLNTPSVTYLAGGVERIVAVTIQMSLSVLVWFSVKQKRFSLYLLAVALHLAVDFAAVVLAGNGVNVWLIEGVVLVVAVAIALIAVRVYRRAAKAEAAAAGQAPEAAEG